MHPADIKASLQKSGSSGKRIAAELQVGQATVSRVITGRDTSRRVATRIATVTGIPISQLWPGRYDKGRHVACAS